MTGPVIILVVILLVCAYRSLKAAIAFTMIVLMLVASAAFATLVAGVVCWLQWTTSSPEEQIAMLPGGRNDLTIHALVVGLLAFQAAPVVGWIIFRAVLNCLEKRRGG